MIVDLIDKLISRIIELLKEEQRLKKSMHDDFIMPLMNQFDDIHENYIETFIKYGETISHGDLPLDKKHPLFKEIKKDGLSSGSMRVKLGALWRALDERRDNSDELMRLLESIANYLQLAVVSPVPSNVARANLASDLIGATKEQASSVVEEKIDQLQRDFSEVQQKYQELKIKWVK